MFEKVFIEQGLEVTPDELMTMGLASGWYSKFNLLCEIRSTIPEGEEYLHILKRRRNGKSMFAQVWKGCEHEICSPKAGKMVRKIVGAIADSTTPIFTAHRGMEEDVELYMLVASKMLQAAILLAESLNPPTDNIL